MSANINPLANQPSIFPSAKENSQKPVSHQAERAKSAEELAASIRKDTSVEEKFAAALKDRASIKKRV